MNTEQLLRKFAYPIGILFPWLLTPFAFLVTDSLPKANVPLLYIVMVVFIAINVTVELAIINALSSFFAFSFFFAEPYGSIMIHQDEDLLTISLFLLTSVLVGYMATKHKKNVQKIRMREFMTDIELELLERLPKAIDTKDVIEALRDALKPWREHCVLITHDDNWATHPMIRRLTNLRKTYLEELLELRLTDEVIKKIPELEQEHDVYFLYSSRQVIGLLRIAAENIPHLPRDIFLLLLHQVNISLERTRLAADLEKEKIAKENELLRSSLLSSVSHDFRTPLTTMIGATSTVLEFGEHLDKQQTKELLSTVLEEAERLNRYTQNLLDMTRLGFGQMKLECDWVSIEEILGVVKKRLRPLLIRNYLTESISPDMPSLYVHAAFLEQAIFNIIDNAIKFSPPDASIDIECTTENNKIIIMICDQGTGIPEDEREKVFERFHTAEKGDRRKSGSGLGLTICRGMVVAHGGNVSILPNPKRIGNKYNPGCCLRIELPIHEQNPQQIPKTEE
ncbi:ATP-binding protein [Cellvibrio sp. pealriver]|uniref:ATP-binding protein n=1 Tax=Cellvibrio sp. pealriver TaxID=1622269 RepID=UPI00066FB82F|nr:ATP-binding protein [Cellvibrio sp. pealriver]